MKTSFAEKKIILTGASSGIGAALLEQLLAKNGQILAVDIHPIPPTQKIPPGKQNHLDFFQADLSDPKQVDALFEYAIRKWGTIDMFIANAGFAYYEQFGKKDWNDMEKIFRLNVFSPLYSITQMKKYGTPITHKTVVLSSGMGYLPLPGYALYSSTKAAVRGFSEAYFYEPGSGNISVVFPIATKTSFFAASGAPDTIWPSQHPGKVAHRIIRGLEKGKKNIYPSMRFSTFLFASRFLPFLKTIYLRIQQKSLERWGKHHDGA